ncbi:hypothetical protein LY622_14310 [Halomonas sp. M5N1S17]|uniref:hypothetical protein n=1 Tax=Halomonas alkalisoli TaxID=2907158 RepID=UPI001F2002D0|nr:hypothetical protein [Halomonas alkalisoli]MCE9664610.1 hypothetical protein [Halomonas alkalisoli]
MLKLYGTPPTRVLRVIWLLNAAYTLDWANEENMLDGAPRLREHLASMYSRSTAPPTIAEAFAAMES